MQKNRYKLVGVQTRQLRIFLPDLFTGDECTYPSDDAHILGEEDDIWDVELTPHSRA